MAIVINGSGTVTGLAVGGLPDGTVDDGTLASGIASSKLTGALPAISGASLTGITSSQLPAGSVLQVVSSIFTTDYTTSSTSLQDTGHTVNITPKSSSSVLYLEWVGNISINTITSMGVAFREGSTVIGGGTNSSGAFWYDGDNTANKHHNSSMMTTTASSGTSQRTFKISIKIIHGSGTNGAKYQGDWGPLMLKITEVAA